ncbi:signal peptide peptidase SppA [Solimonas sp. K1W22B-7]|uniref:signal peptide peptidase SppA n=1 Tax=Solimonas sp. K1W22B-7 TaxID=2303331 RepID=UPI000E333965|nr:signal peptide peptidase SppA [Solimonas sp. K1W22B-7]AXQ29032.1 signal peptide peptidase SppA [Solimonas sp. K1W22B-7]
MSESEQKSSSALGRFFGRIWKIAVFIYRALFVISLMIGLFVMFTFFSGGGAPKVDDNVALVLAPSGALVEQIDQDPGQHLLESFRGEPPSQTPLRDLIDALDLARDDKRIAFAVLKLDALGSAGLPQLEELGAAIKRFQASGKKVIAYSPWYEQAPYFAAALADEIVVDPQGMVHVEGFSVYQNYFKDALDKLGVRINVFRVGEYKSAVEPFTRNDMSEDARKANIAWLGDLWTDYTKGVGAARKLPENGVLNYVTGMRQALQDGGGDTAAYAKKSGLVTHVETLKQFRQRMGAIVGIDDDHGSFRQVHFSEYLRAVHHDKHEKPIGKGGKVALVVVQGEIVDGPGDVGQAGGDTISDLLDQARRDEDVAAVVLRVDSPGGSVWASEQIRREVEALKAEGKPVVASMSTVAASGGYWISMDANQIWAHSTTITGSIGIFGLIPTIDQGLAKIGVHTDGVGTTPLAGSLRLDRPLSPEISSIIQSQIDKGYRDFIGGVAKARKLPVAKVDEIARGRVWSGGEAKTLGLVDKLGDLDQAADAAAKLAGLDPESYELDEYRPDRGFPFDMLLPFSSSIKLDFLPQGTTRWLAGLLQRTDAERALRGLNDPRGMYANCYCTPSMGGGNILGR